MVDFDGVKIALVLGDELLVILRDNNPALWSANMWDFPGGGRENNETPFECAAREVYEELGVKLPLDSVLWEKTYPAMQNSQKTAYFMVANITNSTISNISFGDEGQKWKLIKIDDFFADPTVIEPLKGRFRDYLTTKR